MALVNVGNDSWLLEYNACENLSREIREQLNARNMETRGSVAYGALSGKIRVRLKQHSNEINQLREKLKIPSMVSHLTDDEKNRRLQQVERLQGIFLQAQDQFGSANRSVVVDPGTAGWGEDEDEQVQLVVEPQKNLPIEDIRANQSKMIQAQDQGLAELSQVIVRQKRIAGVIANELDGQNEILDDIGNNMDNVDVRIQRETQSVQVIGRKDTTCGLWVIIILLLVAIIAVGFS